MRQFQTVILNPDQLRKLGVDIELCGITGRKGRPYMHVTGNGHMTWLLPLTTQLKGRHGRIEVDHSMNGRTLRCEAITTDMISVYTPALTEMVKPVGFVTEGGQDILRQIVHSLGCGRLGVYPNA